MASTKPSTTGFKFDVIFEKREDGGLMAYSEDVPGFTLSHSDSCAVFNDVKPSLEFILSKMYKSRVVVAPLHAIRSDLVRDGFVQDVTDIPVGRQEYVVVEDVREAVCA